MRQINWEGALSADDVTWLRQAGFMSEEQIARHQAQFEAEVPEEEVEDDAATQSALDPSARMGEYVPGEGAPVQVDPTQADPQDDEDEDDDEEDYDAWKVSELSAEVDARNALPNRKTDVQVTGTGKDGAIVKADLIKALQLWDGENPGVISA